MSVIQPLNSAEKYFEWDASTWSKAVDTWNMVLPKVADQEVRFLEIGARNGGMTALLDSVVHGIGHCTDRINPKETAAPFHKENNVRNPIVYEQADAIALPYEDEYFDIVIFKSVLGAIGANANFANQEKALREINRVLKPGGMLLFAENLRATSLHQQLRKRLNPWGAYWYYVTRSEMKELLKEFRDYRFSAHGLLACFSHKKWLYRFLHRLDQLIDPLVPGSFKYMIAGYAIK